MAFGSTRGSVFLGKIVSNVYMKALFTRLTQIKPDEAAGALVSFLFVFVLMASYMILRPVRDALPSDWGDTSLAVQWSITFMLSTVAVSIYNFCASKISLKKLVPAVFIFFAASFALIYLLSVLGCDRALLGKVFYVWTSVFSLFHISIFWSFTSQAYSKEQSKRIFGFINTGASVGAICGPVLVINLVKNVPLEGVLLITSGSLLLVLPLIVALNKIHAGYDQSQDLGQLSANPFKGFKDLLTHKQIRMIALFIFLFTGVGAFVYIAQNEALSEFTRAERKEKLASLDLAINALTIILGVFATNRITKKWGLSTALSIVPFGVAALLLLLSMNPEVIFVLALQLLRKSGNYAITRPAREILFTGVGREARFKTKPIIDVAVYRGGDVFWIWSIAILGDGYLNFTLSQKLWVGAGIAVLWGLLGVYLGRKHEREERLVKQEAEVSATPVTSS